MAVVRYLVKDVDQVLPFYEALGFQATERWGPPFVILTRGDLSLWLSGPGTSASRSLSTGATPTPGGWNRVVLEVPDLTAAIEALRSVRASLRGEPVVGPGGKHALFEDPSGNPVELFEPKR